MNNKQRLELSERVKDKVEQFRYPDEVKAAEIDRLFGKVVQAPFIADCVNCLRFDCMTCEEVG